jgi:hypothetical protein
VGSNESIKISTARYVLFEIRGSRRMSFFCYGGSIVIGDSYSHLPPMINEFD